MTMLRELLRFVLCETFHADDGVDKAWVVAQRSLHLETKGSVILDSFKR